MAVGNDHSCGIRADGAINCWGDNGFGESNAPAGAFTAISADYSHSCGIRANGAIACWGSNVWGKSDAPAGVFTAVSAGDNHSCGIRADGAISCWGRNDDGQAAPPTAPRCDFVDHVDKVKSATWEVLARNSDEVGARGTAFYIGNNKWFTAFHIVGSGRTNFLLRKGSVIDGVFQGREVSAELVAKSGAYDIALLEASVDDVAPLRLGVLSDSKAGDTLYLAGYSTGALAVVDGRFILTLPGVPNIAPVSIRSDVIANPGDSGSPLLNACGDVIGLITAFADGGNSNAVAEESLREFLTWAQENS